MRRIHQLDGLRAIAALMIFVFHAGGVRLLWCGADLFFVMSGYLITGILLGLKDRERALAAERRYMEAQIFPRYRRRARQLSSRYWPAFYLRRARRILPPYLIFLLVAGAFFRLPWPHAWYFYVFFAANMALVLGRSFELAAMPLWSLALE